MIAPATSRRWLLRLAYLGLVAFLLFIRLLPMSTLPVRVPGPDLLLCLTLVWVLRRPDVVTAPLIVSVFLLEDMLTLRPPGAWTLLVLVGSEFLRDRAQALRGLPFFVEWAMVTAVTALMALAMRLLMTLAMVPQTALSLTLMQVLTTILAYPLVAGVTLLVFGRRFGRPERDATSRISGRSA